MNWIGLNLCPVSDCASIEGERRVSQEKTPIKYQNIHFWKHRQGQRALFTVFNIWLRFSCLHLRSLLFSTIGWWAKSTHKISFSWEQTRDLLLVWPKCEQLRQNWANVYFYFSETSTVQVHKDYRVCDRPAWKAHWFCLYTYRLKSFVICLRSFLELDLYTYKIQSGLKSTLQLLYAFHYQLQTSESTIKEWPPSGRLHEQSEWFNLSGLLRFGWLCGLFIHWSSSCKTSWNNPESLCSFMHTELSRTSSECFRVAAFSEMIITRKGCSWRSSLCRCNNVCFLADEYLDLFGVAAL